MNTIMANAPTTRDGAPAEQPGWTDRLGMWIFIGTEILFFGGLLFAYAHARSVHPQGFALASRHTEIIIGTANTALLLTSSAAIALAVEAAGAAAWRASRVALWATLTLGSGFLVLKGIEYGIDWREGLFPGPGFHLGRAGPDPSGAQVFFVLYYVMTSLHALHMSLGLVALVWLLRQSPEPSPEHSSEHSPERLPAQPPDPPWTLAHRIGITALYWHFVDVVWILLYPLLYLIDRS